MKEQLNFEHAEKLISWLLQRAELLEEIPVPQSYKLTYATHRGGTVMDAVFSNLDCGTVGCIAGENFLMQELHEPENQFNFWCTKPIDQIGSDLFDFVTPWAHEQGVQMNRVIFLENWPDKQLAQLFLDQTTIGGQMQCMAARIRQLIEEHREYQEIGADGYWVDDLKSAPSEAELAAAAFWAVEASLFRAELLEADIMQARREDELQGRPVLTGKS